jgi:hypothetical protein
MLAQIKTRLSSIPRIIWFITAVIVLAAIVGIVVLVVQPFGGAFTTLSEANPSFIHPDGVVVSLAPGIGHLQVRVTTVPREVFIADQAGAQWTAAHQALPPNLTPLSPIYDIEVRDGQAVAEMAIPNGSEPLALLELYRWEQEDERWVFVPSTLDTARQVIQFMPLPSTAVMAVHAQSEALAAGVIVSQGAADPGSAYQLAIPEGISIDAQGNVTGTPVAATAPTVMPLIDNRAGGFLAYPDTAQQTHMIDQLMPVVGSYNGLVLDFPLGQGYADFLSVLADRLHADSKQLDIVIRGTTLDADELASLAAHADRVWLAPGDNPMIYLPDGPAEAAVKLGVSAIDRGKVGLLVSGMNVEVAGDTATPVSMAQALALFGSLEPVAGYFDPNVPLLPGDSLAVRLSGQVEAMGFDASAGMNYLVYQDSSGQTCTLYFGSARGLSNKLTLAKTYALGAVAVQGLTDPQAPAGLIDGLSAFVGGQPASDPSPIALVWHVTGASGASLDTQEGDLSLIQYLWKVVSDPGEYEISAAVNDGGNEAEIGKLAVSVADAATAEPTVTTTPTATPKSGATPNPNKTPSTQATPTTPFSGSIVVGAFELGGQTHTLGHPDQMHFAGMTWVKFQHKWNPGDDSSGEASRIGQAHAQGFKVLMSVPGPSYPTAIDFAGYVSFLTGLAAQGADGIEVWNEMNLDREWPASDISGASYVNNMLIPAYQAIKGTNPNVLVISGAPSPTGFFGGCGANGCDDWKFLADMRDAGAGNYMDCMGIHYNEGIVSPTQTTGAADNHYTRYYKTMVDTYYGTLGKPLCFTELGYLSPDGYGALPAQFSWAGNTTVAQQAQWLAEAAVLSSQSGKVRLMIVFNVDFTVWEANDPQAGYAMIRPDGSCPACDALHNVQP